MVGPCLFCSRYVISNSMILRLLSDSANELCSISIQRSRGGVNRSLPTWNLTICCRNGGLSVFWVYRKSVIYLTDFFLSSFFSDAFEVDNYFEIICLSIPFLNMSVLEFLSLLPCMREWLTGFFLRRPIIMGMGLRELVCKHFLHLGDLPESSSRL